MRQTLHVAANVNAVYKLQFQFLYVYICCFIFAEVGNLCTSVIVARWNNFATQKNSIFGTNSVVKVGFLIININFSIVFEILAISQR